VRWLAVISLVLAGCASKPKPEPLPAATPAPKEVALSSVGSTLDVIDSRVAAAVTVAREANTAGKPAVVESELSVASSFLPKPTEGDLAYARQRSEKATPADYEAQRKKAAEKQKAAEAAWADLEKQVAANKAAIAARDKRIEELTAEVIRVKKDASSQTWTLVGAGLAVIGALSTAFLGPRIGVPLLLCGAFCGSVPFIIDSPYFLPTAAVTIAIAAGLGLWWLWDKVRDAVNKPAPSLPTMSKPRKPAKVIWRKLGKERAWGQATIGENLIEIDPRLGAKRQLEVLCHEQVHLTFPGMTEAEVDRAGKDLAALLWSQDYRRVLLSPNAKPPRIS
jgi:hypothetical protein